MPPEKASRVTEILRHYAMEHDGDEGGAKESRFKAEKIREEKGSTQDYIAKYICKNIDGEYLDTDRCLNHARARGVKRQRNKYWDEYAPSEGDVQDVKRSFHIGWV